LDGALFVDTGAGPPSPMALMLVPTANKVDYSMTKGGLRLWAVVFVFIFMCSSLYTVFSAHELAEMAVGELNSHFFHSIRRGLVAKSTDCGTGSEP
jgi:hypothetical protein